MNNRQKEMLQDLINSKNNKIKKLEQEKQGLIKYLEDKIEECKKIREEHIQGCDWEEIIKMYDDRIIIYQDILDRIRGEKS